MKFLEVSAKYGTNINALFEEISIKLLERHDKLQSTKGGKKMLDKSSTLSYNYNE